MGDQLVLEGVWDFFVSRVRANLPPTLDTSE